MITPSLAEHSSGNERIFSEGVQIDLQIEERASWEPEDDQRFQELAELSALEEITPAQASELQDLIRKRRIAQMVPDGRIFLERLQRERALKEALRAVETYARFIR